MNYMGNERKITCDGCGPRSLGATKQGGIGAVLFDSNGQPELIFSERHISPGMTSIMAEFLALELGLKVAVQHDTGSEHWVIYTDNTYTREAWYHSDMVRKPHLVKIKDRWNDLAAKIKWRVSVRIIEGAENVIADKASRDAISNEEGFVHEA